MHYSWVNDSAARGALLPEAAYYINDEAAEARFGFSMAARRVVERSARFLAGRRVWITPAVKPSIEELRPIVESAGGEASRGCAAMAISVRRAHRARPQVMAGAPRKAAADVLVVSCAEDRAMHPGLVKLGEGPLRARRAFPELAHARMRRIYGVFLRGDSHRRAAAAPGSREVGERARAGTRAVN